MQWVSHKRMANKRATASHTIMERLVIYDVAVAVTASPRGRISAELRTTGLDTWGLVVV